jgi:transposase
MPKTYAITLTQAEEIKKARKKVKEKQLDKRLHAAQLRGEGKSNKEIAVQLETSTDMISRWVSAYAKGGIEALYEKKRRGGNRRNMSFEEEAALLETFKKRSEAGQMVEVSEIKQAYQEKVGHRIGTGQIYYVLKRHGWRKVKPRSRHPKKALPEVIEASKKLTCESEN